MYPELWTFASGTVFVYPLILCLSFIVGTLLAYRRGGREGLDRGRGFPLAIIVPVSAIAGARILYAIVYWRTFVEHPLSIIDPRVPGMVGYGALLAVPCGIWYVRHLSREAPVWHGADVICPSIPLGIGLYRCCGCFLAGCCYGAPTDLPWGALFPAFANPPWSQQCWFRALAADPDSMGVFRHPTQLYESLFGFAAFVGVTAAMRYSRRRDGTIFMGFLASYAVWRFVIEGLRGDPRGHLVLSLGSAAVSALSWVDTGLTDWLTAHPARFQMWISTSQIVSLLLVSGCALFIRQRLRTRPEGVSPDRSPQLRATS